MSIILYVQIRVYIIKHMITLLSTYISLDDRPEKSIKYV